MAFFARCAMSWNFEPLFGASSACAVGVAEASWTFVSFFSALLSELLAGSILILGASANLSGSGFGATAILVDSSGTGAGATPSGDAAAKRSRNDSVGSAATVSGAVTRIGGSVRATGRMLILANRRATGAS